MPTENTDENSPYVVERRPDHVMLALHGVVARFRQPNICLYPLIDAMRLLVPKAIVLSFLEERDNHFTHVFSTTPDRALIQSLTTWMSRHETDSDFTDRLIKVPAAPGCTTKIWLLLSEWSENIKELQPYGPSRTRTPAQATEQSTDLWLFDDLFARLSMNAGALLSRRVLQILHQLPELGQAPPAPRASVPPPPCRKIDLERIPTIEEFLRPMLSSAWREARNSILLDTHHGGANPSLDALSNIFTVVRYGLDTASKRVVDHDHVYDYSAQLVLPAEQREALTLLLEDIAAGDATFRNDEDMNADEKRVFFGQHFQSNPDALTRSLETPLGADGSSIADTVFQSGLMEYVFAPFDASIRSETDNARGAAERLVLAEHGGRHLSYIPIHVGGTPWLALFSMNNDRGSSSPEFWRYNFHLYNSIVPILAGSLRAAAHIAYRRAIFSIVTRCLESDEYRDPPSINGHLHALSTYFPFPMVQLIDAREGDAPIGRLNGVPLIAELFDNPNACFANALPFDEFSRQEAVESCALAFATHERRALEMSRDNATTWAHEISNAVLPAFNALHGALGREQPSPVIERAMRDAMHWLLFMGATARVRNAIGQRGKEATNQTGSKSQAIWSLPNSARRDVIETALRFLLKSHAKLRANRFTLSVNMPWENESADDEIERLASLVAEHDLENERHLDEGMSVFYSDLVCWPLAVLREVVQNIRLKNPPNRATPGIVHFGYEWVESRADARAVLRTTQRQTERNTWPRSLEKALPQGLARANLAYGLDGAGFGDVKLVSLRQTPGISPGTFEMEYQLDIRFF